MGKHSELHVRLRHREMDALCRFARENGDLSLNAAVKLLIARLSWESGNKMGLNPSDTDIVQ